MANIADALAFTGFRRQIAEFAEFTEFTRVGLCARSECIRTSRRFLDPFSGSVFWMGFWIVFWVGLVSRSHQSPPLPTLLFLRELAAAAAADDRPMQWLRLIQGLDQAILAALSFLLWSIGPVDHFTIRDFDRPGSQSVTRLPTPGKNIQEFAICDVLPDLDKG